MIYQSKYFIQGRKKRGGTWRVALQLFRKSYIPFFFFLQKTVKEWESHFSLPGKESLRVNSGNN